MSHHFCSGGSRMDSLLAEYLCFSSLRSWGALRMGWSRYMADGVDAAEEDGAESPVGGHEGP